MNISTKGVEGSNTKTPLLPMPINSPADAGVSANAIGVVIDEESKAIIFNFEGASAENPGIFSHREWSIGADTEEKIVQSVLSRLKHIGSRFVDEDLIDEIASANWEEYAKKYVALVGPSFKGECNLKLVYRWNNPKERDYISLPLFPNFISTKAKPSVFSTNPKYDRYISRAAAIPKDPAINAEAPTDGNPW